MVLDLRGRRKRNKDITIELKGGKNLKKYEEGPMGGLEERWGKRNVSINLKQNERNKEGRMG